jgi:hypothetical protein
MKRIALLTAILLVLASCRQIVDFYMGVPLQPTFEENSFVPGLNIFGILRPDSTGACNNSFVQVQKVARAVGDDDSIWVDSVGVRVFNVSEPAEGSTLFYNSTCNETFKQEQYRPQSAFEPKAGQLYSIQCNYLELPILEAQTIIPNKSVADLTTLWNENGELYLELLPDSSIYMVDIFIFSEGKSIGYSRLATEVFLRTQLSMNNLPSRADSLVIFSYDYNLADYYLTSNTSLNFNKYRESFGSVQNGYGVFGSLNKTFYRIE